MQRVVILGRGAAGKSTLARRLGAETGLPVFELDELFWDESLEPTTPERWASVLTALARRPAWIMDGDLGPYDILAPRLEAADTVILLDPPAWRCVWRALRRSRERRDFWVWMLLWRQRSRPALMDAIRTHAPRAEVRVVRQPAARGDRRRSG